MLQLCYIKMLQNNCRVSEMLQMYYIKYAFVEEMIMFCYNNYNRGDYNGGGFSQGGSMPCLRGIFII